MGLVTEYAKIEPSRAELDMLVEPCVVEFSTDWCGHCIAAQPQFAATFAHYPGLRHFKIEDGQGRRLGRSFRVKLWPTFIFMRQGKEIARLVRPVDRESVEQAFALCAQGE